jgi:4-hydroxybenzoate polyprenyltransferase
MSTDPPAKRVLRRIRDMVLAADRFVRLHYIFFTCVWPLLGAASVGRDFTSGEISGLLAVILCFHAYAFLLNDVVDLPIDRAHPFRQNDPLVRGTIRPSRALLIALVQPVLTIPLTMWLGGTWRAHAILAAGFVLMAVYNVWGKRCPFPPLTDVAQGLGWGCLAIYAPLALGAEPNALTWMVAAYVTVFTLLFNGIHGDLRDLASDLAGGARTTAIFLGARPGIDGSDAYVPRVVGVYASLVLLLLVGINVALIVRNDFGYGPIAWTATTAALGALNFVVVVLHPKVVRPRGPFWHVAWRLQLYLMMMSLPIAFLAHASVEILIALLVLTVISLPLFGSAAAIVARWAWLTVRSATRSGNRGEIAVGGASAD